MIWRDATKDELWHLIRDLRVQDRREAFSLHDVRTVHALAEVVIDAQELSIATLCLCAEKDGPPIAIMGARSTGQFIARTWMIANRYWPLISRDAARFARKVFAPSVLDINVVRTEAIVLQSNDPARRFVEWFGGINETPDGMTWYGRGGETFCLYARIAPRNAPIWQKIASLTGG